MQFLPADHAAGDANTVGGYAAVHGRPAAFEGGDGVSYSVEVMADRTGDAAAPWGGFLLFVAWRRQGEQGVAGHVETDYVAAAATEAAAVRAAGALRLSDARVLLEAALAARRGPEAPARRWWDAMNDDHPADHAADAADAGDARG